MLHYGQGKWYPGESLPRWAFAIYWRGDGLPLWHDPARVAREAADQKPTADDAGRLVRAIARRLDLHPDCAMPAYEDPFHYRRGSRRCRPTSTRSIRSSRTRKSGTG